ncbi:MAG: hypothetical protein AAF354_08475 [Pseudomonadota bacterium]
MSTRIPEDVAVEAIRLGKWLMIGSATFALVLALLPFLWGSVSNLKLGSVIELQFIQQTIVQSRDAESKEISAQPAELQKLLIDAKSSVSGKSVIWIDDQPENNTAIRYLLEETGLRFEIVANIERAKALIETRDFAVVISDSGEGDKSVLTWFLANYSSLSKKPPWIFYSRTIGGEPVQGAALSTTSSYDVISKTLELAAASKDKPTSNQYEFPLVSDWHWYAFASAMFISTFVFLLWIIRNSLVPLQVHDERSVAEGETEKS